VICLFIFWLPEDGFVYRNSTAALGANIGIFGLDEGCEHCCNFITFLRAVNNNLIGMCEGVCESTVALENVAVESVALKTCSKCHVAKPVEEFYKRKNGSPQSSCKKCQGDAQRARCKKNRGRHAPAPEFKTCPKCGTEKPGSAFNKASGNTDGLCCWCRDCDGQAGRARKEKNKAREIIVIPEVKVCPKCGIEKPNCDFNKSGRNLDGLDVYCRGCDSKAKKERHKANSSRAIVTIPDFKVCPTCKTEKSNLAFTKCKGKPDGLKACCKECVAISNRKSKYGVTEEWRTATLAAQGGGCGICKVVPGPGDIRLCVDHKHDTDIIRGLLHRNCNLAIGHFKDNTNIISKAIEYLEGPTLGIVYKINLDKAIKDKILASQNYKCKICSTHLTKKNTCFDHCHDSGMVRGALCRSCNSGLGLLEDSVELLYNAIIYLKASESRLDSNL
jgi:hypothetical protein